MNRTLVWDVSLIFFSSTERVRTGHGPAEPVWSSAQLEAVITQRMDNHKSFDTGECVNGVTYRKRQYKIVNLSNQNTSNYAVA